VDVIVDGSETDDVIEGYLKRGLSPVLVQKSASDVPFIQPELVGEMA